MKQSLRRIAFIFALLLPVYSYSSVVAVDATNRGWFRVDGQHVPTNKNTFTGNGGGSDSIFRSFFTFDLKDVDVVATSIQLELQLYGIYLGGFGVIPDSINFPFTIYDVSTQGTSLSSAFDRGSLFGQQVYNDLGSGEVYGNSSVKFSQIGSIVTMTLAPQAVLDFNANLGREFSIGIAMDQTDTVMSGISFSDVYDVPLTHRLLVSSVPEPNSFLLVLAGLSLLLTNTSRIRAQWKKWKLNSVK